MQVNYQAPIRGIAKIILGLLTQFAAIFVIRIKDTEIRQMATGLIDGASRTVEVLSDSNPDDSEQLREILNNLLVAGPFKTGATTELLSKIQQITNEQVRQALSILVTNAFPIGDLLTDEISDDGDQLRDLLREKLQSEEGVILISALLSIMGLPEAIVNTLALVAIDALLATLPEDEEGIQDSPGVARLKELRTGYEKRISTIAAGEDYGPTYG